MVEASAELLENTRAESQTCSLRANEKNRPIESLQELPRFVLRIIN